MSENTGSPVVEKVLLVPLSGAYRGLRERTEPLLVVMAHCISGKVICKGRISECIFRKARGSGRGVIIVALWVL